MKKSFLRVCAALLSIIFFIGCTGSPASEPGSTPVSAVSSSPVSSQDSSQISSSASSALSSAPFSESAISSIVSEPPIEEDPGYFIFIDYLLVGSYHDGQWHTIQHRDLSVADLLSQEAYYCYDQTDLIGISKKLWLSYDDEFYNSFYDNPEPLFPFADENDTENQYISFNLPYMLPENLRFIRYEAYNSNISFHIDHVLKDYNGLKPLVISTDFNPLPKTGIKKFTEPYSEEDKRLVKAEMVNMGIPGAPVNITECYDFDYNGDGMTEHFIIANAPTDKAGFQESPYYYLVLCKDGDGYKAITSWCYKDYGDTAMQSVNLIGFFDLNNDGICELCLDNPEWEHEKVYVFSLNAQNVWECVLTGSCGM